MSIDEVQNSIRDGSLFDRLAEQYRGDPCRFDVALYDAGERRTILKVFESLSDNSNPGELGIVHNGLALCLAYCIEVMQSPDTFDDYRFDE